MKDREGPEDTSAETPEEEAKRRRRPPNAGKGRRPGSRNRYNQDVVRTVLTALDKVGGVNYLVRQAEENPPSFLTLVGRCVPREIKAEITAELTIRQEIRRNLVDSLVELMGQNAETNVIDAEPEQLIHENDESPISVEPNEHIPGSELIAQAEEREQEAEETARAERDRSSERYSDAVKTEHSVRANEGATYISKAQRCGEDQGSE